MSFKLTLFTLLVLLAIATTTAQDLPELEEGDSCTTKCPGLLTCLGPVDDKRCQFRRGPDQSCGTSPFSVCRPNLVCRGNICRRLIPQGSPCPRPGRGCAPGFGCLGRPNARRCRRRAKIGQKCGRNPGNVCRPRLVCQDGICQRSIREGGRCDTPLRFCEAGLTCTGNRRKFCRPITDTATSCDSEGSECVDGLECTGPAGVMQCTARRILGQGCTGVYDVCDKNLDCFEAVCQNKLTDEEKSYAS